MKFPLLVPILLTQGRVFSTWFSVFYSSLSRPLWSVAIGMLIVLCETGNGWAVAEVLASKWWILPSKLSFGSYITHMVVISKLFGQAIPSDVYFTWQLGVIFSIYVCFTMQFTAFLYHVFLEAPCAVVFSKLFKI